MTVSFIRGCLLGTAKSSNLRRLYLSYRLSLPTKWMTLRYAILSCLIILVISITASIASMDLFLQKGMNLCT